ncbi:MAG: tetratricopeptide repeat protein [Gammaproteobacteria bacterium]
MTVGFIVVGVVLVVAAVAVVVVPLLRKRDGADIAPVAATMTAVALPALAVLAYVGVSNHDWDAPAAPQQVPASAEAGSLPDAVRQLESKLAESPADADGWLLLGRSYVQLQRLADARRAFSTALELAPSSAAKLDLAEVEIMMDRANLGGDAGRYVEEVLAAEPDNPKALFYGGMVAMLRGDAETLRSRWQKLLGMSPPDNIRQILEQQLAQLPPGTAPAAPAANAADAANATSAAPDADANGIDVSVSITDELAARIGSGAVLFVLARQPGVAGPPIAAVRRPAAQLPTSLQISDANAMIAGRTLGGLGEVELVARVSNGGNAIAAAGDLYGAATWKADGDRAIAIVIDQIVE